MFKISKRNILLLTSISMLLINLILIFGIATFEDPVYVVFYIHVASAWLSYLSFGVSLICHIIFLKKKEIKWGYIGKNSVIVGTVFVAFALFSGSFWFNATSGGYQNIFWVWNDPRMVTTLILLISYVAYLIFGSLIDEREKKYRLTSILGIILFPTIPLSYLSATIFNSLHPLISSTTGTGYIYWEALKLFILFFNLIAITILYIYLVMELNDLDKKSEELDELIQNKMEED